MSIHDTTTESLLRVAGLSVVNGLFWGFVAWCGVYLGSTCLRPRIRPQDVWTRWRERRLLWGGCFTLTSSGAALTVEPLVRAAGLRNLFWLGHPERLISVANAGSATGYLLAALLAVLAGFVIRRRRHVPKQLRSG